MGISSLPRNPTRIYRSAYLKPEELGSVFGPTLYDLAGGDRAAGKKAFKALASMIRHLGLPIPPGSISIGIDYLTVGRNEVGEQLLQITYSYMLLPNQGG
jgi:hypothetical protein